MKGGNFAIVFFAAASLFLSPAKGAGPELLWQKTFGGTQEDLGESLQEASDGGYIITGYTKSYGAGDKDVYLIKTDSHGNLQWQNTFGGPNADRGTSVRQTADSGYIVAGDTESIGAGDMDVYLIKTYIDGSMEWEKAVGRNLYDTSACMQVTKDGEYIIVGATRSIGAGHNDVYLINTDPDGNVHWERAYGGSAYDKGYSVQQTSDGGYIITGKTYSFGGSWQVYLIKTDSSGIEIWQKTFGGASWDQGYSVQQTTDGGYVIAGYTGSFGAGGLNVYLIKTDSVGNILWERAFGGENEDVGLSVRQTTDGGYIIAGYTHSFGAGGSDVYVIKTDSAGNCQWEQTFGGVSNERGGSIQQTTDGGYIIGGWTESFGEGNKDVYLIKLAPELVIKQFEINQCFQQTDGTSQRYDLIETKPFVARVTLEKAAGPRATIKVKLTVYDATTEEQIVPTKQQTASIRPQSPKTLEFIFNDNETRNIKAGDYRFSLIVEDNDATTLLDQNLTYQFKSSKTVRMLTIQILLYDWKLGFWNDRYIEFTEQVFPVPKTTVSDVNHIEIVPKWFLRSGHSRNRLVRDMQVCLQNYNSTNPSRRADFICAVVPDGVLPRNIVGWRLGSAVLIKAGNNSQYILGHETGHIYTLGEEYIDSEPQNADGLWVLDKTFRFDGNPPPLKLDPDGPFIIAAGRPYAGRRCDWADDITAYANPSPYFDQQGNIRWWCTGRYVLEGGYDVAGKRQIATSTFSMMSAATGSAWISGPEYQTLINQLVTDQAKSADAPIPLSAGQDRVLVSGIVDIPAKTAELSPLIFDPNLIPTAEVADPNCRLVFISQLGATLGSFGFGPLESELPESNLRGPFCVVVDLPQDTARIQLTIDGTITAEVQVTRGIPTVTVLSPNGGEQITDQLVISWSASDPDSNDLSYTVEFSHDNGTEWSALVVEHEVNELIVDPNYLPGGPNCLVKVTASDGWNRAEDISDAPFSITTQPPKITILDPVDGAILLHSESMQGRCTAYDPETGDITEPNAIVWTSDVDGFVGKGNLIGFELSLGDHALSATATDPEGKSATDTVGVRVVANLADFSYDQRVNLLDLAKFADRWCATCSEPNWCEGVDLDHSGVIDFADLAELSENWLWRQD